MSTTQRMKIPGMGTHTLKEIKEKNLTVNKNSRKVIIYRYSSVMEAVQQKDAEVKEYMATGIKSIGSYWEGGGSKRKGTGLTDPEIKLLLPSLVTVPANDREFYQKVELFYTEYNVKIPFANGLTLEIGLTKNNDEEISEDNMPINIWDYVVFRHAIQHPAVALSKKDAEGNKSKWFWVFDPESIALNEKALLDLRDKAGQVYRKYKDDAGRRIMLLTIMGENPAQFENATDRQLAQQQRLRELAEKEPELFMQKVQSKHFEELFWILTGINYKLLRRSGDYILTKEGEQLGVSEEAACLWWKDPANSEMVTLLKSSIQAASKFTAKVGPLETKTEIE